VLGDWTLNANVRYYRQNAATFYADLFPYEDSQNFIARDRELAQYNDLTFGLGASWLFHPSWPHWIEKGTLNLAYDRMHIVYGDFHNYAVGGLPMGVPLYAYGAISHSSLFPSGTERSFPPCILAAEASHDPT